MKRLIKSATERRIQSFFCPNCHNKTVYDIDHDVYSLLDADYGPYGDRFICDECGSEFTGSLDFDNKVRFKPLGEEEDW